MVLALALVTVGLSGGVASAAPQPLIFPIVGGASYSNDFGGSRGHIGIDIFASKHQKVVSASDGIVRYVTYPQANYGYLVSVTGTDGFIYNYVHLNNDRPGTDDGKGTAMTAYAPDMVRGNVIKKGQLLGYVGDSGNAENTPPHVHFEITRADTTPINPYSYLNGATRISSPRSYPQLSNEILPFSATTYVPVNIASGSFSATNTRERVVGPGKGGGPNIKTFRENGTQIASFMAYDRNFRGGVEVATGDINGDGIDEIVTSPGVGGGPDIKIFSSNGSQLLGQFLAFDRTDRTGTRVAIGDVDADGTKEVIVTLMGGKAPVVRVFALDGQLKTEFLAYNTEFRGGVDVAVGDTSGDGADEIITAAGPTGGPEIRVYSAASEEVVQLQKFLAYNKENRSGVRVSVGNAQTSSAKDEIITAPASTGGALVKVLTENGSVIDTNVFLEDWWRGGYDVTTINGRVWATTGDSLRRSSIRLGL
jgi:hypothetical protein